MQSILRDLVLALTTKVGYDINCCAQTETDQRQSSILRTRTFACNLVSTNRDRKPHKYSPSVNEVHDRGYDMMLPTNAKIVTAVIAHHARRGQESRSVNWKKNARNDALTLHRQVQKTTVDANWHLR